MLKELVTIANELDVRGLTREADSLDKMIAKQGVWNDPSTWFDDDEDPAVAPEAEATPAASGTTAPLPFTTRIQGNTFRAWAIKNHLAIAEKHKLDPEGSHNNSYIAGAWAELGGEYMRGNEAAAAAPAAAAPAAAGAIPFTTTTEGNAFRFWVNENHSAAATRLRLDREGSHNNKYITDAWAELGEAYNQYLESGADSQSSEGESESTEYASYDPRGWAQTAREQAAAAQAAAAEFLDPQAEAGAIPFTTTTEGNAFRFWVNENHSAIAEKHKLDPEGSHNNKYITDAWAELGGQYLEENETFAQKALQLGGRAAASPMGAAVSDIMQPVIELGNNLTRQANLPLHVRGFGAYLAGFSGSWGNRNFTASEIASVKRMAAYRMTAAGGRAASLRGADVNNRNDMGTPDAMFNYGVVGGLMKERGAQSAAITTKEEESGASGELINLAPEDQIAKFLGAAGSKPDVATIKSKLDAGETVQVEISDFYDFNNAIKPATLDVFMESANKASELWGEGKTYAAVRKVAQHRMDTGYRGFRVKVTFQLSPEDIGQDFTTA